MIIDTHTHLFAQKYCSDYYMEAVRIHRGTQGLDLPKEKIMPLDVDDFVAEWHEAGVDKIVLLASDKTRIWESDVPDEAVAEVVDKHPDKVIGFGSFEALDPRDRFNKKGLVDFVKMITDRGLKGLKLTPPYSHYPADDKRTYPIYDKCTELDIPILFHQCASLTPKNTPFSIANPIRLDDIAEDFPDLGFSIAHLGDPWIGEVYCMMLKHDNVYTDLGGLCNRPHWLAWNLVVAKEYRVLDKVMFGTDGPGLCRPVSKFIAWCRSGLNKIAENSGWPTFSKEEIDGILGNNAAKWLKL